MGIFLNHLVLRCTINLPKQNSILPNILTPANTLFVSLWYTNTNHKRDRHQLWFASSKHVCVCVCVCVCERVRGPAPALSGSSTSAAVASFVQPIPIQRSHKTSKAVHNFPSLRPRCRAKIWATGSKILTPTPGGLPGSPPRFWLII